MVVMDTNSLRGRDLVIDLESGTNAIINEAEGSREPSSNSLLNRVWNGFVSSNGSMKVEEAVSSSNNTSNSVEGPLENRGDLIAKRFAGEEKVSLLEKKKVGAEKLKKKKICKKPPKPPRPPRASSMDAADQKLVQEISEIAVLKRARIERMKAVKRMKNAKSASSNSNLCALIITIIFCFVIIWQGIFSRGDSSARFQGSPESSVGARGGFISVQFYHNASANHGSSSASPHNVEQVSGLDDGHGGEANRVAG